MRTDIPYPCIDSSARVFRTSMSKVPSTRSLDLSPIKTPSTGYQEERTLLLLVVKRRDSMQFNAGKNLTSRWRNSRRTRRGPEVRSPPVLCFQNPELAAKSPNNFRITRIEKLRGSRG